MLAGVSFTHCSPWSQQETRGRKEEVGLMVILIWITSPKLLFFDSMEIPMSVERASLQKVLKFIENSNKHLLNTYCFPAIVY